MRKNYPCAFFYKHTTARKTATNMTLTRHRTCQVRVIVEMQQSGLPLKK